MKDPGKNDVKRDNVQYHNDMCPARTGPQSQPLLRPPVLSDPPDSGRMEDYRAMNGGVETEEIRME